MPCIYASKKQTMYNCLNSNAFTWRAPQPLRHLLNPVDETVNRANRSNQSIPPFSADSSSNDEGILKHIKGISNLISMRLVMFIDIRFRSFSPWTYESTRGK